jgi:hypothetical protein
MAGFTWNTAAGGLTIASVDMMQPAWQVRNLVSLWLPGDQRGADKLIPGVAGRKPYARYVDTTTRTLELKITGEINRTGTPYADRFEGLQVNIDYLITNVVNPTGSGDGTRSLVLTMPDGTTRTESVHVTGMDIGRYNETGRWVLATIDLSIPSGRII